MCCVTEQQVSDEELMYGFVNVSITRIVEHSVI